MFSSESPLLLDVGTQTQNVLLAGHLELIGKPEILHLNLKVEHTMVTSGFIYSHYMKHSSFFLITVGCLRGLLLDSLFLLSLLHMSPSGSFKLVLGHMNKD